MITEIYVKSACNDGIGKYAVVIVEAAKVLHQHLRVIGRSFPFQGMTLPADSINSEIAAVCYGMKWCRENGRKICNVYSDSDFVSRFFYRRDFPDNRKLAVAFIELSDGIDVYADAPEKMIYDNATGKYVFNCFVALLDDVLNNRR